MRRRLVLLSLATTVLVVVSFLVPLGLLVRRQAIDRAMVDAESNAQSVAALAALSLALDGDPAAVPGAIGTLPEGTVVLLDGELLAGRVREGQGSLASAAASGRATVADDVPGGWEIALPVVGRDVVVVVDSFVTDAELTSGVGGAWLLLGSLGVLLVGLAVLVADRMGRGLTRPVEELARSAHRLAEGDLTTRVEPQEPAEIREMGEAFNHLATRLTQLLAEERENVADLSHRLRTPLTSLRLQAETLEDPEERERILAQVDRLERAVTQVIELARSPAARAPASTDLAEVVRRRAAFWGVLAEEQGRRLALEVADVDLTVALGFDAVEVVVDTLVGNVFAHTPPGAGFSIRAGRDDGAPWLEVADRGPGFADPVPMRGRSGGGSTGLGLDIVGKTAASVGGRLDIDDRPGGGAVVRVTLG